MSVALPRGRSVGGVDVVVGAYLLLIAIAGAQVAVFTQPGRTLRGAAPFAVALVAYLVVRRVTPATTVRLLAGALTALAVATVAAFARALPVGLDDPSGFYRVKVLVTTAAGDHNTVGGLLLVGVVASAVLAVSDRRWWFAWVLTTLGLVATLSRGAALVLLAAGVGALAVRARRVVAVATLGAGVVASVAVTALATWLGAAPPASAGATSGLLGASLTGRLDLAARGLEATVADPLLGVGFGRFVEAASDLPFPNLHAHNAFAHLGAEAGVLGLLAVTVLTVTLAVRALRAPHGPVREVVLVGGAALVAHAQVDVLAGLWSYEVLLASLLALAAGGPDRTAEPPR